MIVHRVFSISKKYYPHVEHRATINPAMTTDGLHTQIALTTCGKAIHRFVTADQMSRTCTDGSTYLIPCPGCYDTPKE